MATRKNGIRREIPSWMVIILVVVGVVSLSYFGWQALAGREADPGPPKKVYPGMYDLRAEVQKMRDAKEQGARQNGP